MTHHLFRSLLLFLLVTAAAAIPIDEASFLDLETISGAKISPDGRYVVFTRTWTDKVKDQIQSNLWLAHTDGTRLRELTHGSWRDSDPVWSPDGKRIAFLSERDGTTQIHVLWIDSGEVAQLTRGLERPQQLAWSPDSQRLAFTMRVRSEHQPLAIRLPDRPEGAQWAPPATIIDRLAWRLDGVGPLPKAHQHVFVLDAVAGGTPRQVTTGDYDHYSPSWSQDGQALYISGLRKPDAEYLRSDFEIYRIDLNSGEIRALTDRKGPDMLPLPSPDGKWVAYAGFDDRHYTRHLSHIYLMAPDGSAKRRLAGDFPDSPVDLQWDAQSTRIYFLMNEHGTMNLWFAGLDGETRRLTTGKHVLRHFSASNPGCAAAVRSVFQDPGALVLFDLSRPAAFTTLVDVNADILQGKTLVEGEELWVDSASGWKIQAWLMKPVGFQPDRKYPLVLWIHGGPWMAYNVAFNWDFQHFAAKGYAVLFANPRGSTGYGQEFVSGIQYSYPGKDYDDLMAVVDAALAHEWIDQRNLFVCGASGGGTLTTWIVGHTNRFRAAAAMRPVTNWHSFVGTTEGATWYDQFRSYPWEDPIEYALRSPLHYVANVSTPTLIITGEADLRTPISQSEEFYRALKLLKKETLLIRFPGEFHAFRRPSHILANHLYLLAWFEKHRLSEAR